MKREDWSSWFDIVTSHVTDIRLKRHIFRAVRELVGANSALPKANYFYGFISDCYCFAISTVVRRELKEKEHQQRSFCGLLTDLSKHASATTAASLGGCSEFALFSTPDGACLDGARVKADRVSLKVAAKDLETYVDKTIAHYDKVQPDPRVLADIDKGIDALIELHCRYHRLLKGAPFVLDETEALGSRWLEVFDLPWR